MSRTSIGRLLAALAVVACTAIATSAHAGRSCEQRPPSADSVIRAMALAEHTAARLDQSGASVVVLARAGQNLSEYGLRYSHMGIAWKTDAGPWRVVHELNQCGTATSAVYRQGLGEFFLDDPWRYEAAWVVPTPEVQARLLAAVSDSTARITRLHDARYSIVSYVWGHTYQQSNQWTIETLAGAMEPTTIGNREQAQAWLKFKGYEPTTLKLGPITRLGGRMTAANVAFDDHPNDKRFSDRIETVTVDSVFAWLPRAGLGGPITALKL